MHKSVKVDELLPGMMVSSVIEQSGPMKIKKVGMIRSHDMVKGLKEMGVTLLEIDLDQSLNVEFEEDEPASNVQAKTSSTVQSKKGSITATQRLVATNKQISDVDRQLSQQFHRSLFLPAVDQMPSKWTLYGKPYGYLLAFIGLGFVIGWLAIAVPKMWLGMSNQDLVQTTKPASSNGESNTGETMPSEANAQALTAAATQISNNETKDETRAEPSNTAIDNQQTAAKADVDQNSLAQDEPSASTQNIAAAKPLKANTLKADPVQYESVNGVVLEAGQQVLGYQSGSEEAEAALVAKQAQVNQSQKAEEEIPVVKNAPGFTSITEPQVDSLDSDLLRRIQRVANAVDSERVREPEPLPRRVAVGDLPRIDQLPPAILTQMPSMSFSAHMYASNPEDRWVRVNGKRLGELAYITDDLQLKRIESEKVVLEFKEHEFTMNALTDW